MSKTFFKIEHIVIVILIVVIILLLLRYSSNVEKFSMGIPPLCSGTATDNDPKSIVNGKNRTFNCDTKFNKLYTPVNGYCPGNYRQVCLPPPLAPIIDLLMDAARNNTLALPSRNTTNTVDNKLM